MALQWKEEAVVCGGETKKKESSERKLRSVALTEDEGNRKVLSLLAIAIFLFRWGRLEGVPRIIMKVALLVIAREIAEEGKGLRALGPGGMVFEVKFYASGIIIEDRSHVRRRPIKVTHKKLTVDELHHIRIRFRIH